MKWLVALGIRSRREQQVCILILEARSVLNIAECLKISPRTVKSHLNKLYRYFHIFSGVKRVKLAVLLYRAQLLHEVLIKTGEEDAVAKFIAAAGSS